MSELRSKTHNFGAGPSPLPTEAILEAQGALLDFAGTGIGICEVSHRGKEFDAVVKEAEASIRSLLGVPKTHHILFTQGGGTTQFSSTVLNLLSSHSQLHPSASYPPKMDYIVTGTWSSKASAEATRLATPGGYGTVNVVASTKSNGYTNLPKREDYKFSPPGEAAFVYYCENETVNGVQFPEFQNEADAFPLDLVPEGTPLVADFSSSFLSRPIQHIEKYSLIYAGAQKNLSPAGLTIIIAREDILVDTSKSDPTKTIPVPQLFELKTLADSKSLYNTPPVFPIYISSLVLKGLIAKGGLEVKRNENKIKAEKLYSALEEGAKKGVFELKIEKGARSWMNVVWLVVGKDGAEKRFLEGAEAKGLRQLKGHRSVGGIRASLYNAVTLDNVTALTAWIEEFVAKEI